MSNPTHSELVDRAARWLGKDHSVVITEMASGPEEADAIGWRGSNTTLVECKASRADFLSDRKKYHRTHPQQGMGLRRYYLCPRGLIAVDELPDGWGLLELRGKRVYRVRVAYPQPEANTREETHLLLSLIRRIGQAAPKGVSVRYYTIETKCTATAGVALDDDE